MCNGTRLRVDSITFRLLTCTILSGSHVGTVGTTCTIPRMDLACDEKSFQVPFTRRQFPVRLAFAMTINKSQGQSLTKVGIALPTPVFSHGQLYVALSRATDPTKIKVMVNDIPGKQGKLMNDHRVFTKNIVYHEVFSHNQSYSTSTSS